MEKELTVELTIKESPPKIFIFFLKKKREKFDKYAKVFKWLSIL